MQNSTTNSTLSPSKQQRLLSTSSISPSRLEAQRQNSMSTFYGTPKTSYAKMKALRSGVKVAPEIKEASPLRTYSSVQQHHGVNLSGSKIISKSPPRGQPVSRIQESKYGLIMERVCTKRNHERAKVNFVCVEPHCHAAEKLGCAHCFLEGHTEHAKKKLQLQEFVEALAGKEQSYVDTVQHYHNVVERIEKPIFLQNIMSQLDEIGEQFTKGLEHMKEEIVKSYIRETQIEKLAIEEEIARQTQFLRLFKQNIEKNVFELHEDGEQFETALELYRDTHYYRLMSQVRRLQERHITLESTFTEGFDCIRKGLESEILQLLAHYDKSVLVPPMLSQEGAALASVQKTTHSDRGDIKLHALAERKKVLERQLAQQAKICQEIADINSQIAALEKEHNLQHFPFNLYTESCGHAVECNTVPIFECCKQAYRCIACHNKVATDHSCCVTLPSRRYCMRCRKIFNVQYYTNVPINCNECR